MALAQSQIKRLLAYSSVENMGIITLGLGVGLLGLADGRLDLAVLGLAGGLLHLLNHAAFKSLLFLGAGSVIHGAGTGEMDRLGGLARRMPMTGSAVLVGSVAIAGLPPLNGFAGELLIYLAAFKGQTFVAAPVALPLLLAIVGLALIGGLAAATFLKLYGASFLGEPRTGRAAEAHESGPWMRFPLVLLAVGCVAMGLLAPLAMVPVRGAIGTIAGIEPGKLAGETAFAVSALWTASIAGVALLASILVLALARRGLLARRTVEAGPTWDCGYAAPTPRMQYTGSSFVQPITAMFEPLVGLKRRLSPPRGLFPRQASLATESPDPWREGLWRPLFGGIDALLSRLRWLQHGNLHIYVLYIAVTLLGLLIWQLGFAR